MYRFYFEESTRTLIKYKKKLIVIALKNSYSPVAGQAADSRGFNITIRKLLCRGNVTRSDKKCLKNPYIETSPV